MRRGRHHLKRRKNQTFTKGAIQPKYIHPKDKNHHTRGGKNTKGLKHLEEFQARIRNLDPKFTAAGIFCHSSGAHLV